MALLTRQEAAKRFRVSLAAFEQHVRPDLTPVKIGRRVFFRSEDCDAWEERDKAGPSVARRRTPSGTSVSPSLAALLSDPRAQEIATRLRERRPASTRTASAASPSAHPSSDGVVVPFRSRPSSEGG